MNIIAQELNQIIQKNSPYIFEMLSAIGKELFFPKGILSQSAEAKQRAHKINATIGIAKEKKHIMHLPSVMSPIQGISPDNAINYAPSFGIPELRNRWKEWQQENNPSLNNAQTSLPIVTSGITHGISTFADVWVDPDDVVILPSMIWGNYNMILNVKKGARISQFPIFNDKNGYHLAAFKEKLEEEAQKNKKIIVLLNFPHNPTGYTITASEADTMAKILIEIAEKGTNIIVLVDDSYFGLFYEPETLKESFFTRICNKHPRLLAVKLDGATKEHYVWGLRVGFITYGCMISDNVSQVYDALEKKTAGCIRGTISNASHLSQSIIVQAMKQAAFKSEKKDKFEILNQRAHRVKEVLQHPKYKDAWDVYPFNSGYFMCIRLKHIQAEKLRVHLLDKYGVGLIALGERDIRVAFSCIEIEEIQELFDIVLQGVKDLS
ncbi:MAG: aminotransferase class I/II-fold pyridoxal phosphate-dependent enzyme [Desulfobacterales bacterium]|nr:aminotransferase class I/II-fold pyridoxal phosphate-dependent enzyme [Desulfobacterales bacterium]